MDHYADALGLTWSRILELPADARAQSDVDPDGVPLGGLRAVLAVTPREARTAEYPSAPLELLHAAPGSPAYAMWGCPEGRDYFHHICYFVENVDSESRALSGRGFIREYFAEEQGTITVAYHKSPTSIRIELYPLGVKQEVLAQFFGPQSDA